MSIQTKISLFFFCSLPTHPFSQARSMFQSVPHQRRFSAIASMSPCLGFLYYGCLPSRTAAKWLKYHSHAFENCFQLICTTSPSAECFVLALPHHCWALTLFLHSLCKPLALLFLALIYSSIFFCAILSDCGLLCELFLNYCELLLL